MRIKTIRYSTHFQRALKSLGDAYLPIVRERDMWFRKDCFDPRLKTHKLKGRLKGYWSFSLTQKHRVLFGLLKNREAVFIDVGDHSIYQ